MRWATALIILQVIYLILELAFNARLVDSVSVADSKYFEYLAHVGRILSGAGCTLLGFSLLRKWQAKSTGLWIMAHVLIAALAFPLIYHGQEKIIDALVDSSSAEQRVHAQYIALLKRGLASNAVVFKDIEFTAEDVERPAAKTFINTIGFAVFFAPDYIQSVAENSDQILRHLANRQADELLPDAYANYLQAREDITRLSARYNDANAEFEEQAKSITPQARDIWRDIYIELQSQWEQVRRQDRSTELKEALEQLNDRLDLYFIARNRCSGRLAQACLKRVNDEYNKAVSNLLVRQVEPEYWCKPVQALVTTILQGAQFTEVSQGGGLDCSARHGEFIQNQFLKLYGLSSFGYDSFDQFVASAEVARELRKSLAAKNIYMPENYRLHHHEGFIKGIEYELTKQLAAAFMQESEQKFGMAIEPRLSSEDFLAHPLIQTPLKEALGLAPSADPVALNLSERTFREIILIPSLENQLAKERARLLARTEFFADGEPYAEDGKQYVRSVLVPPVAMGLSLFFGLFNLGGLVAAVLARAQLPATTLTFGKVAFIVLVVIIPLLLPSHIARTEPFQKIVDETQSTLGMGRHYVGWLTSLQPAVYPLGASLADALDLFENQP